MGNFRAGLASYIGSALWWLCDKLWGDAIFAAIKPYIPDSVIKGVPLANIVNLVISYAPAILLFVLGTSFFLAGRRELRRAEASNSQARPIAPPVAVTEPVPAPATPKRKTHDYDIPHKLSAIDQAVEILKDNSDFERPIDESMRAAGNAIVEIKQDREKHIGRLNDLRRSFIENGRRISEIQTRNVQYGDIASMLEQGYQTSVFDAFRDYVDALTRIVDPNANHMEFWIAPYIDRFRIGITAAGAWRTIALRKLRDLRRELSE